MLGAPAGGAADYHEACQLMAQLPAAAQRIASVSPKNPGAFDGALRDAVGQYVATLDRIAQKVPSDLRRQIEVLRSAVQQYKFADAIDARAPLDDWAADHC